MPQGLQIVGVDQVGCMFTMGVQCACFRARAKNIMAPGAVGYRDRAGFFVA
jgi:hypothetical protein